MWNLVPYCSIALGHGDRKNTSEPRRVTALEGKRVVEVSCGAYHTAVRTDAGRVFTFGGGAQGALGTPPHS